MSIIPVVICKDVSKEYKRGKEVVVALKDINLEVNEGDFLLIVGPSGCGKTTLLNIMAGLDQPSSGRVIFDGMDTDKIDEKEFPKIRRQKIGFVFQEFNLIKDMSVFENVTSPLWPSPPKIKNKEIEEKAYHVLRAVDLIDRKDHKPNQLSGGEQQRAAIARALVNSPRVIFCDEPTGNLDTKAGEEFFEVLVKLNKEQKSTIVVVTHNDLWKKYASKIVRMSDGKIV
jgi:putative ABC transport system ATP-binding protein